MSVSPFLKNLPYAFSLNGEPEFLLKDIVENLCVSVKAQDWGPGCNFWVKLLNGYVLNLVSYSNR
jgi:hypothetical protein